MTNLEDIINTLIFLIVAIVTGEFSDIYQRQREALRQAEIRSSILLSVSHDLRTPLSAIIGSLTTYQEYRNRIDYSQQTELIESALEESHRLHRYVENLLQATRLNNNQISLMPFSQSVWPTLERVKARFNSGRLILKKIGELDSVRIQDSLIEQAIYNLVDNALRYSPKNSDVLIEAATEAKAGPPKLIIRIIDSGPGIEKSIQNKVFELFYSGRDGDKTDGGSGIGLTVAKGIIEAHGGTLSVEESDNGCTMKLVLPLDEQQ